MGQAPFQTESVWLGSGRYNYTIKISEILMTGENQIFNFSGLPLTNYPRFGTHSLCIRTSTTTSKQFQYDASQSLTQLNVGCEFDVVTYSLSDKPRTGCSKNVARYNGYSFRKFHTLHSLVGFFIPIQ